MNRQQTASLSQIPNLGSTGSRCYTKIISGKKTGWYDVVIEGTVTLAGAAAAEIYNGGSIAAVLSYGGIEDNGEDTAYCRMLDLLALSQRYGYSAGANVRLTSIANGTYNLREVIRIPFAQVGPGGSGAPWETAHVQADPRQDSFVFVVPNNDVTQIVDAGGTLSGLTVTAYQTFDDQRADIPPIYVPRFRFVQLSVPGAVSESPFYVRANDPIRSLLLSQVDSVMGTMSDIITEIQLLDDAPDGQYIGPRAANFKQMARIETLDYGFAPVLGKSALGVPSASDGLGTFLHNFQDSGRLSNVYNPKNAGNNLRFNVTGLPSAIGGGTAQVFCTITELRSIPGRTRFPVDANGVPMFTV